LAFRLGYFLDTKSYPGDKALYVVDYTTKDGSEGHVFTVFVTLNGGRRTFDIQNNAKFVRSAKDPWSVNFVEPPLGGVWTQEHIALAIKRIEHQRTFKIAVRDLSGVRPM
jgi:hypothetical protein